MSMDKAIKYGKEKRKPHWGAKAVSSTCQNHGGCLWCQSNRQYKNKKRKKVFDDNNS